MFNIGWPELILILFVVLLLFGAGRLPEIAKKMGEAINELKKSMKGDGDGNKPAQ